MEGAADSTWALYQRLAAVNKILSKKNKEWDFYRRNIEYSVGGECLDLFYDHDAFLALFDAAAVALGELSFQPACLHQPLTSTPTPPQEKPLPYAKKKPVDASKLSNVDFLDQLLIFVGHSVNNMENTCIRAAVGKYVSNDVFFGLSECRIAYFKRTSPALYQIITKHQKRKLRKQKDASPTQLADALPSRLFKHIIEQSIVLLETFLGHEQNSPQAKRFRHLLTRCFSLFVDVLSQLPTRRNLIPIFQETNFLVRVALLNVFTSLSETHILHKQLKDIVFYYHFELDNLNGVPFTETESIDRFAADVNHFQRYLFREFSDAASDEMSEHKDEAEDLIELALMDFKTFTTDIHLNRLVDLLESQNRLQTCFSEMGFTYKNTCPEKVSQTDYMKRSIVLLFTPRPYSLNQLRNMHLYPSEQILFDRALLPFKYHKNAAFALPKLGLQFLSMEDYLYRSFVLFFLENTYKIREDLLATLSRLRTRVDRAGHAHIDGWARMAIPIDQLVLKEIGQPKIGTLYPSEVLIDVRLSYDRVPQARGLLAQEWDSLRRHDVLFLVGLSSSAPPPSTTPEKNALHPDSKPPKNKPSKRKNISSSSEALYSSEHVWSQPSSTPYPLNIRHVRGCTFVGFVDSFGELLHENSTSDPKERPFNGKNNVLNNSSETAASQNSPSERTIRVQLDPRQYYDDCISPSKPVTDDIYASLNILVRRKPQESNFKGTLDSLRTMLATTRSLSLPDWIHDILLGYGDPALSSYHKIDANKNTVFKFDMSDTYLSQQHLISCFPTNTRFQYSNGNAYTPEVMEIVSKISPNLADQLANTSFKKMFDQDAPPPRAKFTLTFPENYARLAAKWDCGNEKAENCLTDGEANEELSVIVHPISNSLRNLHLKMNNVPFTTEQNRAICKAMYPGLSLVVGPPGTGKTDLAVQIISNWYHNFPAERILLVAHSNQALNQLFEKIAVLDIAEHHLLRLGSGEKEMQLEQVFTRYGRVSYILERRIAHLKTVDVLANSLGSFGAVSSTCETAEYFYQSQIQPRWETYLDQMKSVDHSKKEQMSLVESLFPFNVFFYANQITPFSPENNFSQAMAAVVCAYITHIKAVFDELRDFRAFEILRNGQDRIDYMLTKEARVVAMTCTHAALKRDEFLQLGFKFNNFLMEEAAQVLEIETFIPMLTQSAGQSRQNSPLQRIVLIGDHFQLPPVIQNRVLGRFSNFGQSMFTRLIRLGVPAIQLDAQGRARPSLADLYRWRYQDLSDLPSVRGEEGAFLTANAALTYEYQFIDVGDFNGQGETSPLPYYYQNLAEAEYLVGLFMYMRMRGYPSEKITVLTTYNGQKALIEDVFNARCGVHTPFGLPKQISTVDKYQGQQNDYILLSLVRTKSVGHFKDIRRLVVALSRARLGLYIFGRQSLFENCQPLKPAFDLLLARPTQLSIMPAEQYPTARLSNCKAPISHESDGQYLVSGLVEMLNYVSDMYKTYFGAHLPTSSTAPQSSISPDQAHDDNQSPAKEGKGDDQEVQTEDELENS